MIPMTLAKIAEIVGGELHDVPNPEVQVHGSVEFDSRKVRSGGLFIALAGARVDGHDFAEKAIADGAVAVLAARPVGVPAVVVKPTGKPSGNAEVFTHDEDGSAAAVLQALAALAQAVSTRLVKEGNLNIVGITGSAGKTSTKDFIATVLEQQGPTVAPPGSFNNEIGHPYTVLRCENSTRNLVSELSARGIGHIAHLAKIAPPRIGVVLNVGTAHLGEFGSRENIAQAKGELVEALPSAAEGGVAVLNADDPLVAGMAPRTSAGVLRYSATTPPAPGADIYATAIRLDDIARASFTVHAPDSEPVAVKLRVFGEHQVSNALAAVAVGLASGLALPEITAALQRHTNASAHRMDVNTRPDGVTVINDAYNANPDSMRAGIAALAYTTSARPEARSFAVLGEMGELGEDSVSAHRELGRVLAKYHVQNLIAVGSTPACRAMATVAAEQGINTEIVSDAGHAVDLLRTQLSRDDVVLVKASNSQGLWRVAEELLATGPA
ncbi:UDP-N-acetylmuramoyl-tripeptide--D-alanyl-D-alanine ligase [Corynebacterium occultum]|uniref:UDP-N-acetylmuramoyl-tripeptide--D-alanyl-D-alanine ligase n=1 Tax=Corynebacterium occultum TaxID=2675219 RepID=A0A6B8WCU1_9CORY|nr:UDP-N-acetylmuramoyl-tripeptide--D-alanyl-D-alanine ligase [Corynebacterium occultum]QGU07810.1 UDP-N-acetylmuramoyl-tripeptide--D-alanyl-D-alanine ligase [Corynebacterium occultum]